MKQSFLMCRTRTYGNLAIAGCLSGLLFSFNGCANAGHAKNQSKDEQVTKPNIMFILIDDLGYKDLGCYGSDFYETPNVDRLADEGLRFTQAYSASAVCSPTRASLMTGKNPARHGITDWTGPAEWHPSGKLHTPKIPGNLPLNEYTIAEALHDNGYATCFMGKWHLGTPEYYPDKQGFDICIAATNAGAPPSYFYPYYRANWEGTGWPVQITDLVDGGHEGEYLTDRLTREATNFLDTIGNRPFFLYLSHYAVHAPFEAKEEKIRKYREKARRMFPDSIKTLAKDRNNSYTRIIQSHAVYAAMIESMDESVGNIMKKLDEKGLSNNTIVIFTSDNGGYTTSNFPLPGQVISDQALPTAVMPYRTGKGWYYEGGIKIPAIIRWPGVTHDHTTNDVPFTSTDFYPTLLEITGSQKKHGQVLDGQSIVPLIEGRDEAFPERPLFWHYPHYHNSGQKPASAIRKGHYKLVYEYENDSLMLFNVVDDIHEDHNLAKVKPALASEMFDELKTWLKETGAKSTW